MQEGKKVAQMVDMMKVKVIIFVPEREIVKFAEGALLTVLSKVNLYNFNCSCMGLLLRCRGL